MTQDELNKVFTKKNLVEVLSYTLLGIKFLFDEYDSQPKDPNYDPDVMKRSLLMSLDRAEKRLIEIVKED